MIYLVTKNQELFDNDVYKIIGVEESLSLLNAFKIIQYDSETTGTDCHIDKLISIQFGSKELDTQIVVDCNTTDIKVYKKILESKYIIGHNLKFDLQFLYNYNIIPRKVYDTMIVEQLLYLGYPNGIKSYSLQSVASERLDIYIDKAIRGNIIWQGLNTETILYSAGDVKYLEDIMKSQLEECQKKNCLKGAKLECDFTPVIAYLEWCGIKLDAEKWRKKMDNDLLSLGERKALLDNFIINKPDLFQDFIYVNRQGNLFTGFDLTPKCSINWDSSRQVIEVCKLLGFNTKVSDKKTGEDKDSVLEKTLKTQKGINDEFLKLYFDYKESSKVCSTYGQIHLNAINPITSRVHTVFRALGASSGRMSSGSKNPNTSLAKLKKIPASQCIYPNLQQLPANHETRSCFVSEEGNVFCSADYSAMEGRLAADIYNDEAMLDDFLNGTGDSHALFAWMVFRKECEALGCTGPKDIKKKAPQWRKAVKAVEFKKVLLKIGSKTF